MTGTNRVAKAPPDGHVRHRHIRYAGLQSDTLPQATLRRGQRLCAGWAVANRFFVLLVARTSRPIPCRSLSPSQKRTPRRCILGLREPARRRTSPVSSSPALWEPASRTFPTAARFRRCRTWSPADRFCLRCRLDRVAVDSWRCSQGARQWTRRVPMLPELATAREQGVAGVAVYGWTHFISPEGHARPDRARDEQGRGRDACPACRSGAAQYHRRRHSAPRRIAAGNLFRPSSGAKIETWAVPITASGVEDRVAGVSMKALTLNGYDGLASLKSRMSPVPEPGPNDLLVQVRAASVNPVDGKITRGYGGLSQLRCRMCSAATAPASVVKTGSSVQPASRSATRSSALPTQLAGARTPNSLRCPAATAARKPPALATIDAGSLPIAGLSAQAGLVTAGRLVAASASDPRGRGRRRQLRRAARQAPRRPVGGHRRREERRLRPRARCRPGDRLHQDRLQ